MKKYLCLLIVLCLFSACKNQRSLNTSLKDTLGNYSKADSIQKDSSVIKNDLTGIKLLISTFRGNEKRNYYGNSAPSELKVIWKLHLGAGHTNASPQHGGNLWAGAGWTGQPLLVSEYGKLFLIQGAFDHHLKKIDAETGEVLWQ